MPHGCGIGGDAFWLIWDAATGRQTALNGSGRAPAGADAAAHRARRARTPAAAWSARHHGARRRPLVGRRARPARPPVARRRPRAGHRARAQRLPGLGRLHRRRRRTPRREPRTCPASARASTPSTGPHGRPWRPGELVRLPALAATLERLADGRLRRVLRRRPRASVRRRAWRRSARPITAARPRGHTSTWTEPIAIDYRGVRVTTHPPNSSGVIALAAAGDPRAVRAAAGERLRAGRGHRRRLDPPRHRGGQAARWPTATPP